MSAGSHRVDDDPPYYAVIFTSVRSADDGRKGWLAEDLPFGTRNGIG